MKIFISQPMSGYTEMEILASRQKAIEELKELCGKDIEIMDSYVVNDRKESIKQDLQYIIKDFDVYWLSLAIGCLAEADLMVMIGDWSDSKGCKIEKMVADTYNIRIIYL